MNLDPFYKNPASSAMNYFNQVPGTITPYYQPYIDSGNQSLNTLMSQYNKLLSNPQAILSLAGNGYQQSPGYKYQYNQGMNAANAAAASGGMLGTPQHQQDAAAMSENLADKDYQQYLQENLGLYGQGLQGMSGINSMGYNASNELANALAANLMNQGNMAAWGQENQNQANSDFLGGLIGLGSSFF